MNDAAGDVPASNRSPSRRPTAPDDGVRPRHRASRTTPGFAPRLPEPWFALFAGRDRAATLQAAADLVVPALADACSIDLVDPVSHAVVQGLALDVDPDRSAGLGLSRQGSVARVDLELGVVRVLATRRPTVVSDLRSPGPCTTADSALVEELRRLGYRSFLRVPLVEGPRAFGVVTLYRTSAWPVFERKDPTKLGPLVRGLCVAIDSALQREESELAVRQAHDFLAAVVHDLRNPLAAIVAGVGRVLIRAGAGDVSPDLVPQLGVVRRAAERMSHLVQDLLDLARIRTGRFSIELARHAAKDLLDDAASMLRPLCEEKKLELSVEVARDGTTLCDHARILQVLSNLVANAIKYTPRGGSIALRADVDGRDLVLTVADTGPGIAAEHLHQIFDRYWQGRPGDHGGAGLGLAIAREIVLAHGGRIWARSARGQGTEVSFTLPRLP